MAFRAPPERVYAVLTTPSLFDKVVLFSGVAQAMKIKMTPAKIGAKPGAAFSLFGDYISGRQLELTPGVRVVQAWRSASWAPHLFSIARFELMAHPQGTKLVFDQAGFPDDEAASLAKGWREHYWEPMAKVLA